jgi:hypothetical protein
MLALRIRGNLTQLAAQCWNASTLTPIRQQIPKVRLIVNAVQLAKVIQINNQCILQR